MKQLGEAHRRDGSGGGVRGREEEEEGKSIFSPGLACEGFSFARNFSFIERIDLVSRFHLIFFAMDFVAGGFAAAATALAILRWRRQRQPSVGILVGCYTKGHKSLGYYTNTADQDKGM